ncbi:hypothetical protein B4N89_41420 [Embleya scabrispora]|uniref:Uncharacterized protein n=1 Tax=Embleya scabrispora TaxID=159449 RepID=A0A1T3NJX2_9ACTN|nr:hypothetical protein [Embleya scabrispora]OPC77038.1 hypothetical protein B4N89_41420 [Embleya scabrispora]
MRTAVLVDETTSGARVGAGELSFEGDCPTLREIIRRRVFQEVARFEADALDSDGADGAGGMNAERRAKTAAVFEGVFRPASGEEHMDRGPKSARFQDPERQCALAIEAFERNGFVVLVGDRQVEDLDEPVTLAGDTEIVFLRLIALVGG